MSQKGKRDSDSLEKLVKSLKIKLTKLTKRRGEFVDCMAKFSLIFMRSCEDLTETIELLISLIEQFESQKGELNAQQVDFLKRCLEE